MRDLVAGVISIFLFGMCTEPAQKVRLINTLDISRNEIVALDLKKINQNSKDLFWIVLDGPDTLLIQYEDADNDKAYDQFLVYVSFNPREEKELKLISTGKLPTNHLTPKTFARFVPERTDDFAWENDLVAFRTYGPAAQRMAQQGEKGGTLSSGLDCWLKRVDYPIIDRWYTKYTRGGSYHEDSGEGYDPYHVGKSRGCGGIGVWKDDSLYVSENFISHKTITNGPLRAIFELTYAPWATNNITINEKKRITIDAGQQLYKIEETISTSSPIDNITAGITLHEKKGRVHANPSEGIFAYWEPIDDSELGTAIVINAEYVKAHSDFRTNKKDLSHLYVHAIPSDTLTFYTGFAWKKAGAIKTLEQWNQYLRQFKQRMSTPIMIKYE